MKSRILKINYIRVAEHLCAKLEQVQDPDTPRHELTFGCVHGILTGLLETFEEELNAPEEHLTEQDPTVSDLTQILFEDMGKDHFKDAAVSNVPGVVVWTKGHPIMLPLVLISVS